MTEECIEVHWTSGSLDEARKVARYLVQERYVACVQITPWIESIYMFNNQLETTQESKVVFKTRLGNFESIKKIIKDNCSYEIPEITYFKFDGGNSEYIQWLHESTPEKKTSEYTVR